LLESYKITMDSSYGQGYQDLSRPKPKLYKATCVGVLKQKGEGLYDENMIVMDINLVMKYQKEYEKQQGGGGGGGDVIIYGDYIVAPGRPSKPGMPSPGGSGSDSGRKHIYNQIVVMVDETKNVQKVEKAIRDMGFSTSSSMSYLTEMQEQTKFLRMILGAIGGISFFVAALSITNTMIMSIYERTREIGVMKVIGCRIRDVRSMFLVEAGIIGIVGGVAGVGLSYGMSALLNSLARSGGGLFGYSGTSAVSIVPPWLALVALLLATFVGVVSGLYPAIRATRLPALEALRNE
jgi:ABC-type antimicrobial peptide transport system permease subunit